MTYIETERNNFTECVTPVMAARALLPFGGGGTGYGSKLMTSWKVKYNNRLYRVYAICFSNTATYYILSKGQRLFLNMPTCMW